MSYNNSDLAQSFPTSLRDDAVRVAAILPQPSRDTRAFSVQVSGETVLIPYRIYHDPALIAPDRLTPLQLELLDCLLTRHHSGFVREKHLNNILCSNHEWIPPFIVQLVGEYVIEILQVIRRNVHELDPEPYGRFLKDNPAFLRLTKQRVMSYWQCYHRGRWQRKEDYDGFQIMEILDRFAKRG